MYLPKRSPAFSACLSRACLYALSSESRASTAIPS
jgi:hypothetical protein